MNPEKAELVSRRIAKAKQTLDEVDILIENKLWNTAINRLYYASFYAVIALLHNYELDAKTHSGVKRMFGLHFIKPGIISERHGEFYADLFEMRQDADYEDEVEYEKEDVLKLIRPAHELVASIEEVLLKA